MTAVASPRRPFLTAEWRKLIMANYVVDPSVLEPYLPAHTELDRWQGNAYCSLVAFMFRKVRVRGVSVPLHTRFPEVNLRFYVKFREDNGWKRGVVFISEIVPKPAITWVANTIFREHYRTLPMRHAQQQTGQELGINYAWKFRNKWNRLAVSANAVPQPLETGSKAEFITEHFWGYAAMDKARCSEYQVEHPRWDLYPVLQHEIDCDFAGLYGPAFANLSGQEPQSVFLAEGSPIKVWPKKIISL